MTLLSEPTFIEALGCSMYLHQDDRALTPNVRRQGAWEPLETEVVVRETRPGDRALDIGANAGYYTLLLAKCVGSEGSVVAFEPEPDNLQLLEANLGLNGLTNVTVVSKAVSSASGSLPLYISEHHKGTHSLGEADLTRRSVTVEALSLDDYLVTSPDSVDFIKMDIEGAEGHALRGMGELLRRNPHCRLLTEFSPWNLRSCGTDPQDFLQALTDRGFHLYVLDEHDQQISEADTEGLLQLDPHNEDEYTNLFCTPTEWRWEHWLGRWRIGWEERLEMARRELAALATSAEAVIVVDDQAFGDRLGPPGRRPIPFLERDGEYWGPPVDGGHAARELERLRDAGAELIVFAWPAFWWLDFYPELEGHLRSRYRCVLANDRLIAYELASR